MDVLVLIALVVAVAAAGRAVGRIALSNGGFGLGELFRASHDLGWPHGVQEEDGPGGWGARVRPLAEATMSADDVPPAAVVAQVVDGREGLVPRLAAGCSWRITLRPGPVVAGTARR
jgi:hypothetical protein